MDRVPCSSQALRKKTVCRLVAIRHSSIPGAKQWMLRSLTKTKPWLSYDVEGCGALQACCSQMHKVNKMQPSCPPSPSSGPSLHFFCPSH